MKKIFSFLMSLIITFTMISCQCSGVNNKQTIEEPIIEVVDSLQIDSLQIDSIVVRLTPKENKIPDEDFKVYSKFTKALFQHRNKKIKNALIDSRHMICDLDKKEMKKRINAIEDDEINDYLKKRVIVLTPEEILFLSKEINSILTD